MVNTTETHLSRAQGQRTLTPDTITEHATWLGADGRTAAQAADRIVSGDVRLLAVNGWMASGKDTIAPAALDALGVGSDRHHGYFAQALKGEVDDDVLPLLTDAATADEAETRLVEQLGCQPHMAAAIADRLTQSFMPGHGQTAYSRTTEIRWLLQQWGTEVRRAQDQSYWVKLAMLPILDAIAGGRDVLVTDARFVNEADAAQLLGFHVVRLDITRETQRRRLMGRDGLTEEEYASATGHASETALDDYPHFDVRIDNNGGVDTIPAVVARVVSVMTGQRAATAAA